MNMFIWYCPACDRPISNWRVCPKCKGEAVYQKFLLWPVEPQGEDEIREVEIIAGSAAIHKRARKIAELVGA